MSKTIKNYETEVLGFKIRLREVATRMFEGELQPDIDYEALSKRVFNELIHSDLRLTGNHLKFMRKYLGLRQEDMLRIADIAQPNWSRLEKKGNERAFESDSQLIGVKAMLWAESAKQAAVEPNWHNIIRTSEEHRDPESTFILRTGSD